MSRRLLRRAETGGLVSLPQARRRKYDMRFGAEVHGGGVRFRLWAPKIDRVELKIESEAGLRRMSSEDGWHNLDVADAGPGTLYRFVLPDGTAIPDPASRFQPQDVHGPSEVIDPSSYEWRDSDWRGRPWHEAVLYELHVGAFTAEGTFRAAIQRLDTLADLGISAIELMPVADFPGRRNWGYDGVFLFAPESSYGRPEDMKAFVEAAHHRGLMVILDVVYNHFGPDGNYLPTCAPIFTDRHQTPWGNAVNFDSENSEIMRELVVSNACYWIEEYNLDGLRLDAVHAIKDDSGRHILDEIAEEVRASAGERRVHLTLEDERNTVARLTPRPDGRRTSYTAQWNDDLHHALHVAITGEDAGYYSAFAGDWEKLGRSLAYGFARPDGTADFDDENPCAELPPTAFIAFLQNHDQVGNRAFGDRITSIAPREAVRAAAAIYLLAPQIPMLFMGEEWGTSRPFPFFCDFNETLSKAVREGRRAEFAHFPAWQNSATLDRIPDATVSSTFMSAKLDWENAEKGVHSEWGKLYRALIAVRRREIVPRLAGIGGHCGSYEVLAAGAVSVRWRLGDGSKLTLVANLSAKPANIANLPRGRRLWPEGSLERGRIGPWTAAFTLTADSDDA